MYIFSMVCILAQRRLSRYRGCYEFRQGYADQHRYVPLIVSRSLIRINARFVPETGFIIRMCSDQTASYEIARLALSLFFSSPLPLSVSFFTSVRVQINSSIVDITSSCPSLPVFQPSTMFPFVFPLYAYSYRLFFILFVVLIFYSLFPSASVPSSAFTSRFLDSRRVLVSGVLILRYRTIRSRK